MLHVFAEADIIPCDEHIQHAATMGASLIGVNLDFISTGSASPTPNKTYYPGLFPDEINLTLAERNYALANLNDQIHSGGEERLHWPPLRRGPYNALVGTGQCGNHGGMASSALEVNSANQ